MKGEYTWRLEQKKQVVEAFSSFTETTGMSIYNPKETAFGGFRFCRSGIDAGSVMMLVAPANAWDYHKAENVVNFIRSKFSAETRRVSWGSAGVPAGSGALNFRFYPFGWPEYRVDTLETEDALFGQIRYRYNNISMNALDYQMDMNALRENIDFISTRTETHIYVTQRSQENILERFNRDYAERAANERKKHNTRSLRINRMRSANATTGGFRGWILTSRPEYAMAADKSEHRLETDDAFEAYQFLRNEQLANGYTWYDSNSHFLWADIAVEVADKLLGIQDKAKPEGSAAAPAPSFLND